MVDDGSGFWHAISAAEYLARGGASVELITPARGIGLAIPHESVLNVSRRLGAGGVRVRVLTNVVAVAGRTVALAEGFGARAGGDRGRSRRRPHGHARDDDLARALEEARAGGRDDRRRSGAAAANHAVLDANLAVRAFDEGRLGPAAFALS